jgi:leader peptidase (prepilin peptidase)/N-methyltransferase
MPSTLLIPLSGLFGLMIGSFLNVCIYRLPRRESIVFPASRCPQCRAAIRWFHNLPVVGYLWLGGRCHACREPISVQYPIVEATTGILFAIHAWVFGWDPLLVPRLAFCAALVVLFVIDLHHRILPNVITLRGLVVGLASSLFLPPGFVDAVIGTIIGGGGLWIIAEVYYRVRGEEGLGMGDVKMLGMIGAFLGWQLTLLTLVLSSFAGALVGGLVIALGKGDMKYALPYGTFLAMAAVVASLTGTSIIDWYAGFYR